MTEGIGALTDKEKQALRLLLTGHDAKTSAASLDLSVHTINDRLRNARRKLGVSSSREAARILGDAEGGSPQNAAHSDFGIAETSLEPDIADLNEPRPAAASRTVWLTGGMLIMSIIMAAIVVGTMYSADEPVGDGAEASAQTETGVDVAENAAALRKAERFLAHVDDNRWEASWQEAGPFFQSQASLAEWTALIEPVRPPLGAIRSREVVSVDVASTLPGAPEGDYTILQYRSDFANRSDDALETVILLNGETGFQVMGYFIRQPNKSS